MQTKGEPERALPSLLREDDVALPFGSRRAAETDDIEPTDGRLRRSTDGTRWFSIDRGFTRVAARKCKG
jgi:hypothetical protein